MMDPKELRRAMGHFASGVTIVTTHDGSGTAYGLTANAFTSLSLDPPLCIVCVDRKAESFPHFERSRAFNVNILASTQEELSNRFAKSGGDKFAGLATTTAANGAPLLTGALATIECAIAETLAGGDHVIHVGRVERCTMHEGEPLLYFQGKYRRLAGA
jgi:3-hydroxy-9,10-secoandrosta-1,3,5(10)-triene-9,17-dione monooxygenase reductase component